jgi:hypothetical protein
MMLCAGVLVFGGCGVAEADTDTTGQSRGIAETTYDRLAAGTWIGSSRSGGRADYEYEYFLPIIGWTDDGEFILGDEPELMPPLSTLIISDNRFSYTRLAVDRNTTLGSDFYEINSRNPILGVLIAANGEIATPALIVGGVEPDESALHMWRVSIFQVGREREGEIFISGTHPDGDRFRSGNAFAATAIAEPDGSIRYFGDEITLTGETLRYWRFNNNQPMTRLD